MHTARGCQAAIGENLITAVPDSGSEGISLTESALRSRRFGAYTLQSAIAAVHAEPSSAASTDWRQITLLYDRLFRIQPSPVVELNRAVAVACEGPEQVFVPSMACWPQGSG